MKLINIFLSVFVCFIAEGVSAQWEHIEGPYGPEVSKVVQNTTTQTLFAMSHRGQIFRRRKFDNRWEKMSVNIGMSLHNKLGAGKSFVCTTSPEGLYISYDDGGSWVNLNLGGGFGYNNSLYCNDNLIIVTNNAMKIFVSMDSGYSFTELQGNINSFIEKITSIVVVNNRIIVLGEVSFNTESVCYSDDWGSTWHYAPDCLNLYLFWPKLRVITDKVFLVDGRGVFVSEDFGVTWNQLGLSGIPANTSIDDIFFEDNVMYLALRYGGLYASFDNGNNFYSLSELFMFSKLGALEFFKTMDGELIIASTYGIYKKKKDESLWRDFSRGIYDELQHITVCDNRLFLNTLSNGTYVSQDGVNWIYTSNGIIGWTNLFSFLDIISIGNRVVVGTDEAVFYTDDYGQTWTHSDEGLTQGQNSNFNRLKIQHGNVYAATSTGAYFSEDSAKSWQKYSNIPSCYVDGIAVQDSIILIGNRCFHVIPDTNTGYFTEDIFRSTNNGASFTSVYSKCFSYIEMIDSLVFAVSINEDGKLYRSDNRGLSWYVDSDFDYLNVSAVKIIDNKYIYIGTNDGRVVYSADTAKTWIDISENLFGAVKDFCTYRNYLYVVTGSNGVWRRLCDDGKNDKELSFQIYPNPALTHFYIETQEYVENGELLLYNLQGQLITGQKINAYKTEINTRNLSGGFYLLKITDGENFYFYKLVKR